MHEKSLSNNLKEMPPTHWLEACAPRRGRRSHGRRRLMCPNNEIVVEKINSLIHMLGAVQNWGMVLKEGIRGSAPIIG
jgi:hypothetical protein